MDPLEMEPLPPWEAANSKAAATVPSLQELVCGVLASHLDCFESLDVLPEHLAAVVRAHIQRDRRLLRDEGIAVWVEAVMAATSPGTGPSASARKLNLRWAASLTDDGLKLLAENCAHWAGALVELDLGFCEGIGDAGVQAIAPSLGGLRALVLNGCRRCGDASLVAIGRNAPGLERLEADLLQRVTDHGIQAIVRGCPALLDLRIGGCSRISNISTSLIADHCSQRLTRLGVGGCHSLTDLDLEEVGKCRALTHLDLCACAKLSDAGLKSIGKLAERQLKAHRVWEDRRAAAGGRPPCGPPPTLTHLNLGGLGRMSDDALLKLTVRAAHLLELDVRGCSRLTEDGLAKALAGYSADGVQAAPSLAMPKLTHLVLCGLPGSASERVIDLILRVRPKISLVR